MPSLSDLCWFISKPKALRVLFILFCTVLTTELVLIYYVFYQPEIYLDSSRARFFAPWLVWVFPPVVTFMLLRLIKVDADALRRRERKGSTASSGES